MKTLFFDLDGTLTDSKPGIIRCIQFALSELKVPVPNEKELLEYIGPPLQDSFSQILDTEDEALINKAIEIYRKLYSKDGIYETSLYEGIEYMLNNLSVKSQNLFVVTSKPTYFARKISENLDISKYFKEIHGSELDGTRINKADLIRYILNLESISPKQALMIGDRKHDILGAKLNNVIGIGVLWGYGSFDELINAGADKICSSPEDLLSVLDNL